jgi:subtilase family serine protease
MSVRRLIALLLTLIAAHASYAGRLVNNTPGFVKTAPDTGAVDPTTVIAVTAWLEIHNKASLDALLRQQNTPGSAHYHAWLTQAQIDATYSPTAREAKAVQNFLSAHDLTILAVAENNLYVKVQGAVADIEKTFHVQIDNFNVKGVTHRSNTADPSVDPAGGLIVAVTGLDDVEYRPTNLRATASDGTAAPMIPIANSPNGLFFEGQCLRGVQTHTFSGGGHTVSYTGNRYGADISNTTLGHLAPCGYQPSEVQTAYNMTSLYGAGLDGTGQTVVIVDAFGSTTIRTDAEVFSQVYGLPDLTPANFQVLSAPGTVHNPGKGKFGGSAGWVDEITLDVEWVHSVAPGANIALVISPNNGSDLDEAINWAVVHHLGNTISNSWSSAEGFGNPARLERDERILELAAAQGIDVNFSSGDFGDGVEYLTGSFKTVGYPASSPNATGVGGTSLFLNPDNTMAFQTGWGSNVTRLTNPDGTPVVPPLNTPPLGFQYGAGGGASLTFARPSFQSGLSVPGGTRLEPDIGFLADPFTGVEVIETVNGQLSVGVFGGTSVACPMFSGIMAIAAQKAGHGLGQAAPLLYNLPAGAVADVTAVSSPNNVTGLIDGKPITANQLAAPLGNTSSYFSALYNSPSSGRWDVVTFGTDSSLTTGPGWDDVTGVGTPNGLSFVDAIAP